MRALLGLLLLTACGSEPTHKSDNPSSAAPEAPTQASPLYAMALDSTHLPGCTQANVDQLVYLKDLKQFQVCDGATWAAIDITGPAGAAGPSGPAGQATVAPTNEWLDPITNYLWLVGGSGPYTQIQETCKAPWSQPTRTQIEDVIAHGLNTVAVTHPSSVWIDSVTSASVAGGSANNVNPNFAGIYCVQVK